MERSSEMAVDLVQLRQQKDRAEANLKELAEKLYRAQNVDELHIEIDLLQNTPPGIQTLKERLYQLKARHAVEKNQAKVLDSEFEKIKPKLKELRNLMEMQQREQDRQQMLEFEISRLEPIHNRISEKKQTLLSQEELIQTLAREVKLQRAAGAGADNARTKLMQLAEMDLERDTLLAKKDKNLPVITRNQEYLE